MTRPFCIMALPRSRTAWLSHWLSYPPKRIGHDTVLACNSIEDFTHQYAEGMDGSIETIAVVGWRLLRQIIPDIRLVVVRRPIEDVRASLRHLGVMPGAVSLEEQSLMLDEVARQPGVRVFDYGALARAETCAELWKLVLDIEFDAAWWLHWHGLNVQVNLSDRLEQLAAQRTSLLALHQSVLSASRGLRCQML